MRLLLDTCSFLWLVTGDSRISDKAKEAVLDLNNEVFLSSVSAHEIAAKQARGRLVITTPAGQFVPNRREAHGILESPFTEEAGLYVAKLPPVHKDPFDRMLIAQANAESMILVTPDPLIHEYPVRFLW